MEIPDCFFIVDIDEGGENQKIQTYCVSCYEKSQKTTGWFWEGSKRGYGPFVFKCDTCGTVLYKPEE